MFLLDWFYSLGLWQKEARILLLGLENAGKTTLLHMLEDESIGQIKFKALELGSHQDIVIARVWEDYQLRHSVDAVVYLVDASDGYRFFESKIKLQNLLSSLDNMPFLILGNKIDIPYAASEDELKGRFFLQNYTTGKGRVNLAESNVRPTEVFMCSIVRRMGYREGFKWLSQYIKSRK